MNTALLILPVLLFAFTTNAVEPVLDTDGEPLLRGNPYYVLPVIWPAGGGLLTKKTGNQTCPVSVVQAPSDFVRGIPVIFQPVSGKNIVFTDRAQEIAFAKVPDCAESGKWLTVDDMNGEYWSVGIGGPQDHKGSQTLTGYFKIHKIRTIAYSFSFVPVVNGPTSGYLGIALDKDGNRRLVVTGEETFYRVVFLKAYSEVSKM